MANRNERERAQRLFVDLCSHYLYVNVRPLTISSFVLAALTEHNRAQIPNGPSNIGTYQTRHETSEDIAMGRTTRENGGGIEMTKKLAEWDEQWRRSSVSGGQ